MEILLDVVMEKNSLEEKTSLSTQVGTPGPAAWAFPPPTRGHTCSGPATGMYTTETNQVIDLFTCLRGCRRTSDGTDVTCLLTSRHLQEIRSKMDEDLEKRVIEAMPVVSSLCFHAADVKNKADYRVNVRCGCGAKQVGTVCKSSKRPTFGDCLRE